MGRDGPANSRRTRAVTLLVAIFLLSASLSALSLVGPVVAVAVSVLLAAALALALRSSAGPDEAGSVWDAIPSWQYAGRHVESGGLTRDEQERALRDVQREAEERDRRP